MASSNTPRVQRTATHTAHTHEGAAVVPTKPLAELRRSILACLLFEDNFYEGGVAAAERIAQVAHKCSIPEVLTLAVEARGAHHLRHAPLWLIVAALDHPKRTPKDNELITAAIYSVCDRADQMGELVAQYMRPKGKRPLANCLRAGLRLALARFNEYELSKYAARGAWRIRDVMFLIHAKPADEAQAALWKKVADDTLETADTWETRLSGGEDKGAVFTDLLTRHKLGGLALIRNLRNMREANVEKALVATEFTRIAAASRLLPFQFLAAARACPGWEDILEQPMIDALADLPKLTGKTVLLIDISGSMNGRLSAKGTLNRLDGARALAVMTREVCEEVVIGVFDTRTDLVPPRRGFGLVDAIPDCRGGTDIAQAVKWANKLGPDRIIVFTDEQSMTLPPAPHRGGYIMNVAGYQNGVGYGKWITITGFSDQLVRFMHGVEDAKVI